MLGCDVRTMEDPIRDMLTNREVLAIHADAKCQPFPATKCMWGDDTLAWAKQLSDGGYALLYANMTDNAQLINTNWWDLGLPPASGVCLCRAGCLGRGGSRRIRGGLPALGQAA